MADVLAEIVAHKRVEVEQSKLRVPLEEVKQRAKASAAPRNFFSAVTRPRGRLRVIAEIKKASPSAGVIRRDFDPVAIAKAYHANGAAAISCLTDAKYFQGSLEYIAQIKEAVPLPVLRKDFIVDPYQVYEARAAGADAILLIAECLDEAELLDLLILATELKLTTLVEVHDVESLLKVRPHIGFPHPTYTLLGINNRDLKTMTTDLNHTLRLLDMVENRDILVSESGIKTPADVRRLRLSGVHRILVGEHLMRQPDVGAALKELVEHGMKRRGGESEEDAA
jgi:indole-3-glycerol phosphate synthase